MIVSINQPAYLPWLGYFHRIAVSDVHVVLDHVQLEKNSFVNRNRVRTPEGSTWLTVPVETAGRFGNLPISTTRVSNQRDWSKKHQRTLVQYYRRAPYFLDLMEDLEPILQAEHPLLRPLLLKMVEPLQRRFGITTPLISSSDMCLAGNKSDLILECCQKLGASVYLSGPFGRDYLDVEAFRSAGIAVVYQDYRHPPYTQCYPGFVSHLSALDALMSHTDIARTLLMQGNATRSEIMSEARAFLGG